MAGASIKVYGVKNCDTVRKARAWLDAHDVEYQLLAGFKPELYQDAVRAVQRK